MKKVISNLKAAMKNAGLFLIIQSILYILLAGLLIAAVVGIYRDGAALRAEDPLAAIFSREIAAKALRKIAPAFLGAVGTTAAGLVLNRKNHTPNDPIGEALSGIPPRDRRRPRTPHHPGSLFRNYRKTFVSLLLLQFISALDTELCAGRKSAAAGRTNT